MATASYRTRLARIAAVTAITAGLTLSTGVAARAHPVATLQVQKATSTQAPITVNFNLFAPNAPVTFTFNGATIGTGTTNANGDVTFTFTPVGLAPGYYRLVATTSSGITSSVGFSVRGR